MTDDHHAAELMKTVAQTPMPISIRALQARDRKPWEALYRQYADFYQSAMTDAILDRCWLWLMNPNHAVEGLVAEGENQQLLGLAHFRACPDPLIAADFGFLDDLFVHPDARGLGIGRSLISGVASLGQERKWAVLRWITADSNAQARQLYDKLAQATHWISYDLDLQRLRG